MSKKGENIYRRKDNRWEARYRCGSTREGKPKYRYCYGKTYREVKEKLNRERAVSATSAAPTLTGRRKFSFYCDEWMQMSRDRVKESTYAKYSSMLRLYVRPYLGGYTLSSLTPVAVENFSHQLLNKENLSTKSVRDILILLHSILGYVSRQNPYSIGNFEMPYPKETRKEMRILTREEQALFVRYLLESDDECKFGVLLALSTGLRIGEICALRWGDISLPERSLRIRSTLQRLSVVDEEDALISRTKIVITDPKSNNSAREIPMTDFVYGICRRYHKSDRNAFILTGTCRYMEPRTLQYRFRKYMKECELSDVHFHTLRHTFATRCVEVEFEIKSLSEILGHANPRITLDRYVHTSMRLKRENMEKLNGIGW